MLTVWGKSVPTELSEMLEPATTAFLIIDMQNAFCSAGGSAELAGGDLSMYPAVVEHIAEFADECRRRGLLVIHVKVSSLPNGLSDSAAWLRLRLRMHRNYDPKNEGIWQYTEPGSSDEEFVPALQPMPGDVVVTKYRSSAFYGTNLDLILRSNGIRTVVVAGCTTEGCVDSTVRDLGFHDYFAVVLEDCVASDIRDLHDASLLVMRAYRADVVTSDVAVAAMPPLEQSHFGERR
jgi:nicotinamidase-related amidase